MFEPDVTLSDLVLAGICFGFAAALIQRAGISADFALLFAALGLASTLGGAWHGWFSQSHTTLSDTLWLATMLAVGLANTMLWLIAGEVLAEGRFAIVFRWIAAVQFLAFAYAAIFLTRDFLLPSAASVPPTLALLLAFALALWGHGPAGLWFGVAGIVVAILGAGLQQARAGLPALRLGYNAVYHAVQAVAFLLLFLSVPAIDRLLAGPL